MQDGLLGVVIDVELGVLLGEPDEDVVRPVDVGVLHVPPTLCVLKMVKHLHDVRNPTKRCKKTPYHHE